MHDDRSHLPRRQVRDLFELGRVVATPAALELLASVKVEPLDLINRHQSGDWGDLDEEDRAANERALNTGGRLFSSYNLATAGAKVWVITEWDRSYTTLLLPADY